MTVPLTNGKLVKLKDAALELLRPQLDLPAPAAAVLAASPDVPEALARLIERGFLLEATRLMAHALPRREGVWWGCMCAAATAPHNLAEADILARETAEAWVRHQSDALRREAMAHARSAGFQTPESWCAAAAFWSGDSLTEPDQAPVAPAPHLAGTALAGAVALASVRAHPERQQARLQRFLASAEDIAAGGPGRLPPEPG